MAVYSRIKNHWDAFFLTSLPREDLYTLLFYKFSRQPVCDWQINTALATVIHHGIATVRPSVIEAIKPISNLFDEAADVDTLQLVLPNIHVYFWVMYTDPTLQTEFPFLQISLKFEVPTSEMLEMVTLQYFHMLQRLYLHQHITETSFGEFFKYVWMPNELLDKKLELGNELMHFYKSRNSKIGDLKKVKIIRDGKVDETVDVITSPTALYIGRTETTCDSLLTFPQSIVLIENKLNNNNTSRDHSGNSNSFKSEQAKALEAWFNTGWSNIMQKYFLFCTKNKLSQKMREDLVAGHTSMMIISAENWDAVFCNGLFNHETKTMKVTDNNKTASSLNSQDNTSVGGATLEHIFSSSGKVEEKFDKSEKKRSAKQPTAAEQSLSSRKKVKKNTRTTAKQMQVDDSSTSSSVTGKRNRSSTTEERSLPSAKKHKTETKTTLRTGHRKGHHKGK
eukprot:TRINITY_DN4539_c0_g1_i1.p1 TRINITY_DN4539_c0_g1~~TRINITY_DN4539_c0_g1_i1.p1  ORF type:complete len:450 (-),score=51.52 TRINITY_DN4539_c0_g1_i1:79-1428(-)